MPPEGHVTILAGIGGGSISLVVAQLAVGIPAPGPDTAVRQQRDGEPAAAPELRDWRRRQVATGRGWGRRDQRDNREQHPASQLLHFPLPAAKESYAIPGSSRLPAEIMAISLRNFVTPARSAKASLLAYDE